MWRVILLVFCYHAVSQPVTDEPSARHTRELIECCPCHSSNHGGDMLGRTPLGSNLRASMDDCPCRLRSADAEGASSMFFPRTSSAVSPVPFIRSNDPNDIKNLLEPEVGLATSMLQTLREATEEDYRDALAREAARSSDAVPEESARNVVIIVKPRASDDEDDFVSEASNVKEARCINPVRSSLGRMKTVSKPIRTLPDFFRLPKARQPSLHRNLWGMDSNAGSSNVQQSVVDKNGGPAEFKPRSPLFKLRTPLKEHSFKSSINGDSLKSRTVFDELEQNFKNKTNLFGRFHLPLIPKMKVDTPLLKGNNDINKNSDLSPEPSNIHELIEKEDGNGHFKLNKRPLMLKNLLKLKDVELIPKTIPKIPIFKSKLNTNDLALPTSLNRDADSSCDDSTYDSAMNEKVLMPKKVAPTPIKNVGAKIVPNVDSSLQNIVNGVGESEEDKDNQDSLTSPSEITPNILDNMQTENIGSDDVDSNDVPSKEIITSTTERILEENESNETLDPTGESEIFEHVTENNDDSKICENDEISENGKDISEPDIDSSNNIGTVIPFTLQDNEEFISQPPLEKYNQDTIHSSDRYNEDVNRVGSVEDQAPISEPKPEVKKSVPNIKPIPALSETLSTIKDNVMKSLENLKKTTQNVFPALSPENNKIRNLRIDSVTEGHQEPQKDEFIEETYDSNNKVQENQDNVTFNDLQKLSDDLLVLSSNKEQNIISKETEVEDRSSEPDLEPNQELVTEEIVPDYIQTEPTTTKPEMGISKDANIEPSKGKTCHVGIDLNKIKQETVPLKSVIQDEDRKDMTVEASAPIVNAIPAPLDPLNLNEKLGSTLLQNINPLDPLNLNEELGSSLLPNLDPLNFNNKLRSPVFPGIDPLNLNEKLASPIPPNLDPLNLNLGSPLVNLNEKLDPLNLNANLNSLLQPNFDNLNVRSSIQDIIMQPYIPEDPLNLLGKPVGEVLKLPTLEDLRQRLSSVFDTNDRSAENNFSDEEGDCTNDARIEMTPAASTSNFRKVPSIKPLEDMNVDIFQLNPLSKPDLLSNAPRLNLKNFRAKLPIPNNLDLKPVKLESRLGNNKGNILGASLTFGNDKATLRNAMPNSNVPGLPLGSLPSLDELRDTFLSNTQSLLSRPLHPNLDLFRDSSLRASDIPDIDEIRRNAEKTMKGLQQRMKSTFKGKMNNPLSEKLLEDVNDKLKAIHYDFNDRLSSIHEDILDHTRLKPLSIPVHSTFPTSRNTNKNIMNNIRKTKGKPARLQASASTISSQEIDASGNTNAKNILRSPARINPKKLQTSSHRTLHGAESSPVATKVEFPKPKTTVDIPRTTFPPLPRLPSLRQGSESLFPQNVRGKPLIQPRQPSLVKDMKKPLFRKPSPFKDKNSKVTITFATTTASPVTSPINQFRTTPSVKPDKSIVHIKPNSESLKERLALSRSKTFGDAKQSASEFTPSRIKTPLNSKTNFKTANSGKDHPQLQSLSENTKSKLSSFKGLKDSKLRLNENNSRKLDSSWTFDNNKPEVKNKEVLTDKLSKPLVWPQSGEDSFLAKVREAMQARLKSFNPVKDVEKVEIPKVKSPNTDMLRSASENSDVIVDEPLKENLPYKCRMLCTRE